MTLILVPCGRGRWSPLRLQYDPKRRPLPSMVEVRVNDRLNVAGVTYRVARVEP